MDKSQVRVIQRMSLLIVPPQGCNRAPIITHSTRVCQGADWTGPEQFENPNGELMMLPTDVALVEDPKFEKFVVIYQQDEGAFFTVKLRGQTCTFAVTQTCK